MKLIVGLGNPGKQYIHTRHNIGFLCIDALAAKEKLVFRKTAGIQGEYAKLSIGSQECYLLKPTTFMNNSGVALKAFMAKKGIKNEDILVLVDEISIPFGQMRLRPDGSAGGHNGLKSIIEQLASSDFARLRLGVSKPKIGEDQAQYVLSDFTPDQKKLLADFIETALDAVASWAAQGAEQTMNRYNKRKSE